MKKLSIITLPLLVMILVAGCKKNEIKYGEFETVDGNDALLKINFVSNYAKNPSVHLKINGDRVSNLITARTPFPGGGYNTGGGSTADYLALNPGTVKLSVAVPFVGTANDSVELFNTDLAIQAGKYYTAHITDTGANTKVLLLTEDYADVDSGLARYRFVNLMPNVPAVDLYNGSVLVAANIPYLSSSDYFTRTLPPVSTAWSVREAGASPTSTALATYTSASTILNKRTYTAFALGYKGQTDAARRPYISFLLNK